MNINELYELLKQKLNTMRSQGEGHIMFDFSEVAHIWQFVCLMKQVKEIVNWSDKR